MGRGRGGSAGEGTGIGSDVRVEVLVLGPVALQVDGVALPVASARQRVVLARLAATPGAVVSDDALIDTLWPDAVPDAAQANLQTYVSKLRRRMGKDAITREPAGYRLALDDGAVDLQRFTRLLDRADAADDPAVRADALAAALELWRGAPFADLPDPLVLAAEATWLEGLRRDAEESWFEASLEAGRARRVLPLIERAAVATPVRERVHLALVRALAAVGRPADALRAADAARTRMIDESGLEPSPALARLEQQILRSLDDRAADAPSSDAPTSDASRSDASTSDASTSGPATPAVGGGPPPASTRTAEPTTSDRPDALASLGRPVDRFVGRGAELAELDAALADHRIVTVTGPGGMGKTRLVAEWLATTAGADDPAGTPERPGGPVGERCAVVIVRSPLDSEQLRAQLADAVGLRPGSDSLSAALRDVIGSDPMLVLVDGAEPARPAVAEVIGETVAACPGVRVLVTSRRPVGVPGERVVRLGPLAPDEQVELFVDRARLLRPDLEVSDAQRDVVGEIGTCVDGLPLGIELAARREATLGLAGLRDRLVDALDAVEPAPGEGRPGLAATVASSYELLSPPARSLLDRLTVCAGPVPLAAVDAIGGSTGASTVSALSELVEASLVVVTHDRDPPGYRLLEVVRATCARHLDATERETAERAHVEWVLDETRRTADTRDDVSFRAAVVVRDLADDVALAVDRAAIAPEAVAELAARVAVVLADHPAAGLATKLRRRADDENLRPTSDTARSRALWSIVGALTRWIGGDVDETLRRLASVGAGLSPDDELAWVPTFFASSSAVFAGRVDAVEEGARDLTRMAVAPRRIRATAVCSAALANHYAGRTAVAEAWMEEHAELLAAVEPYDGFVTYTRAELVTERDPEHARALLARAIERCDAAGQSYNRQVARVASLAIAVRSGVPVDELLGEARSLLTGLRTVGMWPQVWMVVRILAELFGTHGEHGAAVVLLDAAEHDPLAPELVGPDRERCERVRDAACEALGPALSAETAARARAMTRAQAVDAALDALDALVQGGSKRRAGTSGDAGVVNR